MTSPAALFEAALVAHSQTFATLSNLRPPLMAAAEACGDAIRNGNKLLFCGNGGSAADAQHLAAELVGRLVRDRRALVELDRDGGADAGHSDNAADAGAGDDGAGVGAKVV